MNTRYNRIQDISYNDLINLTGITGILDLHVFQGRKKRGYFVGNRYYKIKFNNNQLCMSVIIDIKDNIITVSEFKSTGKSDRIFLKVLYAMQFFASIHKFDCIKITADGYYNDEKSRIGYIVAGKYGFLMGDHSEENYFARLLVLHGFNNINLLYDLLLNPDGIRMWTVEGQPWSGTFYLWVGSTSKNLIKDALARRRLKTVSHKIAD